MSECPVCGGAMTAALCPVCGYDLSADYGRFPTFAPLPPSTAAPAHWQLLRCPTCGSLRFGLQRKDGLFGKYKWNDTVVNILTEK